MPITFLHSDDDDRVDGRELAERDEPGSDDLLLRGLLLVLARMYLSTEGAQSRPADGS